jgi:hypothetical protein
MFVKYNSPSFSKGRIGKIYFSELAKYISQNWQNIISRFGKIYFSELAKYNFKIWQNIIS